MLCTLSSIINMEVIPVIYILDGQAVALYKGNFDQKEVYRKSPFDYAKKFVAQGAKKLYLVDLNASEYGEETNIPLIKQIRKEIDVEIMCAGGIRTMDQIKRALHLGMNYIVLGVSAEKIYKQAIDEFGADKIIVGIKAKGDEVLTDIERKFPLTVIELAERLPEYGVKSVLFKDLWKESTMIGPNYDEPDRIKRMTDLKIYYSGGIGKEKHLETLKDIGVEGAVIGKALYERELYLKNLIGQY